MHEQLVRVDANAGFTQLGAVDHARLQMIAVRARPGVGKRQPGPKVDKLELSAGKLKRVPLDGPALTITNASRSRLPRK